MSLGVVFSCRVFSASGHVCRATERDSGGGDVDSEFWSLVLGPRDLCKGICRTRCAGVTRIPEWQEKSTL